MPAESVRFSTNGKKLSIKSANSVALWDILGKQQLLQICHEAKVKRVRFSLDEKMLLIAFADNKLCLFSANNGDLLFEPTALTSLSKIFKRSRYSVQR